MDLRQTLILVPTRHAGRRLRAELARLAAQKGTAVLSGAIVTPEHLLPLPADAASDSLALALLARCLVQQHDQLAALFPSGPPEWSHSHALGIAAQLQDVRRQLAEADLSAAELLPFVPDEEQDRWRDIARLEKSLLLELRKTGRQDAFQARRESARNPPRPLSWARVVSLFVPDLSALAVRTLQSLSESCNIDLHILAPESEAERFDTWGRPRPDRWESQPLPLPQESIRIYEQAGDETAALARLAAEAEDHRQALALCTPDPVSARALARQLEAEGRELYLPNGIPLDVTQPGGLLADWLTLLRQGDYAATAAFLRHPDAQDWLARAADPCPVGDLLQELDDCQNMHLPATFEDLRQFSRSGFPVLARALEAIAEARKQPLADFLASLYDCRSPEAVEGPLFADAAQAIARLILDGDASAKAAGLSDSESRDLLLTLLPDQQIFPKPNAADTREALGWLEIQWETAPAVLLSEMREGVVPETRVGDAFLPDGLRAVAGIPGNREALARDLFLTRTLLESRPAGAVQFLYSRRAANQDPRLPSRILIACPDDELPERTLMLFDHPGIPRDAGDRGSPQLILKPPACTPERIPENLSVTGLKDYLACPFRFYLGHVLHMEASGDSAREMDALLFGSLAHEALEQLHQHPELSDEHQIRELLTADLERRFQAQFGSRPSLALTIQLESLRERLGAAARIHSQSVRAGWHIVSGEKKFITELDGMEIHGRIDRIERHDDGRVRILDYKTSDGGLEPIKTHYQPGNRAWLDLQLPLYRYIYSQANPGGPVPEVGYFNLPKAVAETGIRMMDFQGKDGDLYESAMTTARDVVKNIQAGVFWPPKKVQPDGDAFHALAPNPPCLIREVAPR